MGRGTGNRILLIDDDEYFVTLLTMKLAQFGHQVDTAVSSSKGYELALNNKYDIIVLDVLMPHRSGIEICSDLRTCGILTPVLILSGKTEKNSIVKGLEVGADDYLTKPFSSTELMARIKALVRRNQKTFRTELMRQYGVELDIASHTVRFGQHSTPLTRKETLLLKRLMSDAPKSVPRAVLLQDVWGIGDTHTSNRLDVYIRRLRSKLKALSGASHIHTIRGRGYYFNT